MRTKLRILTKALNDKYLGLMELAVMIEVIVLNSPLTGCAKY